MFSRRNFVKLSVALGATSFLTGCSNLVETRSNKPATDTTETPSNTFPLGIIYTRDNPGKWDDVIGGHVPVVTVEGEKITIETVHGMSKKHYIVRHTIVDMEGKVLAESTFFPEDTHPVSVFKLPSKYKNVELYATSFCNQHDMWVEKFKV